MLHYLSLPHPTQEPLTPATSVSSSCAPSSTPVLLQLLSQNPKPVLIFAHPGTRPHSPDQKAIIEQLLFNALQMTVEAGFTPDKASAFGGMSFTLQNGW